jgi:hypothetical protein
MFNSREETLHTLHNWIELSAGKCAFSGTMFKPKCRDIDGRGYVRIGDSDSFDLGEPYIIGSESDPQPVYMMSVFHQLHCLVRNLTSFRPYMMTSENYPKHCQAILTS